MHQVNNEGNEGEHSSEVDFVKISREVKGLRMEMKHLLHEHMEAMGMVVRRAVGEHPKR